MRILLDTNVVLDVLLKREPWVTEASAIWKANDDGRLVGYLVASAVTDIYYVARRLAGREAARAAVQTCLDAFEFCREPAEPPHAEMTERFVHSILLRLNREIGC